MAIQGGDIPFLKTTETKKTKKQQTNQAYVPPTKYSHQYNLRE